MDEETELVALVFEVPARYAGVSLQDFANGVQDRIGNGVSVFPAYSKSNIWPGNEEEYVEE